MWTRMPAAAQDAGEDRGIGAGDRPRVGAQLAREHDVAGLEHRRRGRRTRRRSAPSGRPGRCVSDAAARARRGPMPIFSTALHGAPARIARASTRIGASTSSRSRGRGARVAGAAQRAHRASAMIGKTTR